jgi:lipid II:glycine glycyltransferase (peptidoglycan interpeptide bridge formation enzyme)
VSEGILQEATDLLTDRWAAWDRFVERTPAAGFMQTSWWARFRSAWGFGNFGAVLRDSGCVVGGATVLRYPHAPGACFYYIPEGPVIAADEGADEVFHALMHEIDRRRRADRDTVSHLRIEPRWERLPPYVRGFRAMPPLGDPLMEPRSTLCVDLRGGEEALLAQMKPKGRYNIRVGQRYGVEVTEDSTDRGLLDFLVIYEEMAARQGLGKKPVSYFRSLMSLLLAHGRGALYHAECGGRRLASAIVVFFGQRATYFFGASRDVERHVMAPYLLHFEIMLEAMRRGCAWYDFWGAAPPGEPDHPWAGISEFKRKFGGEFVQLVPTLDYVFDEEAYAAYRAG